MRSLTFLRLLLLWSAPAVFAGAVGRNHHVYPVETAKDGRYDRYRGRSRPESPAQKAEAVRPTEQEMNRALGGSKSSSYSYDSYSIDAYSRSKKSAKGSKSSKSGRISVPTEVSVTVNDFYIGYVIPNLAKKPNKKAVEQLRRATEAFWTDVFTNLFATQDDNVLFKGVDLSIIQTQYGDRVPIDFVDFYVEFAMEMKYDIGTALPPNAEDSLDLMKSIDLELSTKYVEEYVKPIPVFSETLAFVLDGVESTPPSPPGSFIEIQVPRFSLAFDIPGLVEVPTARQVELLVQETRRFLVDDTSFRLPFGYLLEDIQLTSVEAAFNAGIPDEEYNYYVVFDATYELVKDNFGSDQDPQPTPEDIFELIATADTATYIVFYIRAIDGFQTTKDVALDTIEPLSIIREKVPSSYIAYAGVPSEPGTVDLDTLAKATSTFWKDFLTAYYSDRGVEVADVDALPAQAYYGAGIPSDGYSYWVSYDITVSFGGAGAEPPGPYDLLVAMSSANLLDYIMNYVQPIPTFRVAEEAIFRPLQGTTTAKTVAVSGFYIEFFVEDFDSEPTTEDLDDLVALTREFFHKSLLQYFDFGPLNFKYVNVELKAVSAGTDNIPNPDFYNYAMYFTTELSFTADSLQLPTMRETYESVVFGADLFSYRREYVSNVEPFRLTTDVNFDIIRESFLISPPRFSILFQTPDLSEAPSSEVSNAVADATSRFFNDYSISIPTFGYFVANTKLTLVETAFFSNRDFNFALAFDSEITVIKEPFTEEPQPSPDDVLKGLDGADFVSYVLFYIRPLMFGFESTKAISLTETANIDSIEINSPINSVAFSIPGLSQNSLDPDQLQSLVSATQSFWLQSLTSYYSSRPEEFIGVTVSLIQHQVGAGVPEAKFNLWAAFDVVARFNRAATLPTEDEMFTAIASFDFTSYILNSIRPIQGFMTADELDFRALNGIRTTNTVSVNDLYIQYMIEDFVAEPSLEEVEALVRATQHFLYQAFVMLYQEEIFGSYKLVNVNLISPVADTEGIPQADFYNYILRFGVELSFVPGTTVPTEVDIADQFIFSFNTETYRREYLRRVDAFALTSYVSFDIERGNAEDAFQSADGLVLVLKSSSLIQPTFEETMPLVTALQQYFDYFLSQRYGGSASTAIFAYDIGTDVGTINPDPSSSTLVIEFAMDINWDREPPVAFETIWADLMKEFSAFSIPPDLEDYIHTLDLWRGVVDVYLASKHTNTSLLENDKAVVTPAPPKHDLVSLKEVMKDIVVKKTGPHGDRKRRQLRQLSHQRQLQKGASLANKYVLVPQSLRQ